MKAAEQLIHQFANSDSIYFERQYMPSLNTFKLKTKLYKSFHDTESTGQEYPQLEKS